MTQISIKHKLQIKSLEKQLAATTKELEDTKNHLSLCEKTLKNFGEALDRKEHLLRYFRNKDFTTKGVQNL